VPLPILGTLPALPDNFHSYAHSPPSSVYASARDEVPNRLLLFRLEMASHASFLFLRELLPG
jgi:hypothetical protein